MSLKSLVSLTLASNFISGRLDWPVSLLDVGSKLSALDLQRNSITGPIPVEVLSLFQGLKKVYLNENSFSGAVEALSSLSFPCYISPISLL